MRSTLDQWQEHAAIEAAELVTSELVTNAVRHARTRVDVAISQTPAAIRLEVLDRDAATPRVTHPLPTVAGGRGMSIVEQLASAWGVLPVPPGAKCVWAELPRSA